MKNKMTKVISTFNRNVYKHRRDSVLAVSRGKTFFVVKEKEITKIYVNKALCLIDKM